MPIRLLLAFLLLASPLTAQEAEERRDRSIARLTADGVRTYLDLPVIETEAESTRRETQAVLDRAAALLVVAAKGTGANKLAVANLTTELQADGHFSPWEAGYVSAANPSERDVINASWRLESAWVMLWSLGLIDDIGPLDHILTGTEIDLMYDLMSDPEARARARLRPQPKILDAADHIYRANWGVVDARVAGNPAPPGLNASVIYERHYALNWLIGYLDQAWDDITTDT